MQVGPTSDRPGPILLKVASTAVKLLKDHGFIAIVKALPVVSEQSDNLLVHLITAAILIFVIIALITQAIIGAIDS